MRISLVLFLFFSLLQSGCSAQDVTNTTNATQAASADDQFLWDFGVVKQGTLAKHEFVINNNLDKVLNIEGVSTSCGCTASEAKKKTLVPGESTVLDVTFNSKDYVGQVTQFVYVHTDNIENPLMRYIIKADVEK